MHEENKAGAVTDAEWAQFILRGLISYHERMHMCVLLNMEDGSEYCKKAHTCPAARHDGYLQALKFALTAVEEKLQ